MKKIKIIYKKILRIFPEKMAVRIDYFRATGRILNLKRPIRFGEKIQWLKFYGDLERYTHLVDKYEVRKYIEDKIGKKYLNELYGIYANADEINFDELPQKFVLKATHGSGDNIIYNGNGYIDINKIRKVLNKSVKENFYYQCREPQYKNIKPRIICERYLEDEEGKLKDYKFFCFNGKVEFIEVIYDRFYNLKKVFYDTDWNKLNLFPKRNRDINIKKPENLKEMIEVAQILSEEFHFVRVDLYSIKDKIYFGELTFTPGSGYTPFEPISEEIRIGDMLNLKRYK